MCPIRPGRYQLLDDRPPPQAALYGSVQTAHWAGDHAKWMEGTGRIYLIGWDIKSALKPGRFL